MSVKQDIPVGTRFGRLIVCGPPEYKECGVYSGRKYSYMRKRKLYPCTCDCGEKKMVVGDNLKAGCVTSCGCKRNEMYIKNRRHRTSYGSWNTPLFKVWQSMIRRCHSSKAPNRKYYYDRGIKVCQLWQEDFSAFEKWAYDNGYERGLQLDRVDVNGNYEPSNCRWITPRMNSHNRTNNSVIEYNGEKRRLVDVLDETSCEIDVRTVWKRIFQHGWEVTRALTEPKHYQSRKSYRKREIPEVSDTERGTGGFGSTGV